MFSDECTQLDPWMGIVNFRFDIFWHACPLCALCIEECRSGNRFVKSTSMNVLKSLQRSRSSVFQTYFEACIDNSMKFIRGRNIT